MGRAGGPRGGSELMLWSEGDRAGLAVVCSR